MLWLISWFQGFAQESDKYQIIDNVPYYHGVDYDSANHKLNLVIPNGTDYPPLLIWIGGGAWSYVDRQVEMDLAKQFAMEGIAVASVGHRLSPATWKDPALDSGIQHPEHIKDLSRAIKYLFENTTTYGFSSSNFFIGGFSSGAHLAALIVMDTSYLHQQQVPTSLIQGVIPIAGTFDIPHYYKVMGESNKQLADNHVGGVFGLSKEAQIHASPTNYLKQLQTPMLLISCNNTLRYHQFFENQLETIGFENFKVIHPDYGHSDLWKHLSHDERSIYRDSIVDFIHEHLDKQTP